MAICCPGPVKSISSASEAKNPPETLELSAPNESEIQNGVSDKEV